MTDHTIDILRQVCQEELDDKVADLTDGTEDIFEGRKEFANTVLGLINKLERPRQEDQADKLRAKAVAASNARNEVATQYNTEWHPIDNGDFK
tara:strand:+ start:275 stop:553 length:279 start_codon:yes stop_codon:yes gene_type:complete